MPLFGISQAEFVIKFVFRCSRKQYQNKKKKNPFDNKQPTNKLQ